MAPIVNAQVVKLLSVVKPAAGWSQLLFPGAALAAAIALLTAVGPNLQYYTFSALGGDAPSIYGSAYHEAVTVWPSLWEWLFDPQNWIFGCVGVVSSIFSVRQVTPRRIGLAVWVSVSTILTAIDVVVRVTDGLPSSGLLAQDVISNIIGGGATASVVFMATGMSIIARGSAPSSTVNQVMQSALILTAALAAATLTYYLFFLFYQPLSVDVDIVARTPLSGYTISDDKPLREKGQQETERKFTRFNWIPHSGLTGSMSVRSPAFPVNVTWSPSTGTPIFQPSIAIFLDCFTPNVAKLRRAALPIKIDASKPLAFQFNSPGAFVDTERLTLMPLPTKGTDISMFWLQEGKEGGGIEMTEFKARNSRVRVMPSGPLSVAISVPLLDFGKKKRLAARTLTIVSGSKQLTIRFVPKGRLQADKEQTCRPVQNLNRLLASDNHSFYTNGLAVTLLFSAQERKNDIFELDQSTPTLTLDGLNGWVTLSKVAKVDLPSVQLGETSYISFQGAVSDLQVDGMNTPVRPIDPITAAGNLEGEYVGSGEVRFHGHASQLWKNGRRLNLTRWERASTEFQIAMLSAFLAGLFAFIKIVWPIAWRARDEQIM